MDWNDQALALHADNANFHALAAQLWALKGEFKRAIASLKMAQQLNPKHPTVSTLMECLQHQ
jgi:protein involved in temperature-dependent protein secretion